MPRSRHTKTITLAFTIFVPLAFLLVGGAALLLQLNNQQHSSQALTSAENEVDAAAGLISTELRSAITGLQFLAAISDMDSIFYDSLSDDCQKALLHYIKTAQVFDQIRYVDNLGMEVLRINYNQGKPVLVPKDQLQDKSDRYYFTETMALSDDEIYISPFDLNMEHGAIEFPRKPMIRFSSKVYGSMGEQLGVIILNYSGHSMLQVLSTIPAHPGSQLMLLNTEGYWLKGSKSADEWGFMYDEKQDVTFAKRYPTEWKRVSRQWDSHQHTAAGIFASSTICITDIVDHYTRPRAGQGAECWKLVSYLPQHILDHENDTLSDKLFAIIAPMLAVLALGALLLAHMRTRSTLAEAMVVRQIESNARFVPREFLGLLDKGEFTEVDLTDHVQRPMTTLFTDIRSYTKLSESMTPSQVLEFLNAYYQVLDPLITENDGFIDAFIGDAVMALFPEGPEGALHAAIDISKNLQDFTFNTGKQMQQGVSTGFGLHTGEVTLGAVGTDHRLQTTAIGDAVNLASRIESATKLYQVNIIVSGRVVDTLPNASDFLLRSIDLVRVKGKQEVVELFEVFDADPEPLREQKRAGLERFNQAMALYRGGEFDQAAGAFTALSEQCPDDPILALFIKRSTTMMRIPAGSDWAGISTL